MAKVFVIHQPAVRDRITGRFRPQHDLTPALEYGEVVNVLPAGAIPQDMTALYCDVFAVLDEHGFSPDDYVLALGDPAAIAVGVIVATEILHSSNQLHMQLLKWDRRMASYVVVRIPITSEAI